jgi:hypothetical protein
LQKSTKTRLFLVFPGHKNNEKSCEKCIFHQICGAKKTANENLSEILKIQKNVSKNAPQMGEGT